MTTISKTDLDAFIDAQGYRKGQGRIGVEVYLSPGKRPKRELTVTKGFAFVYSRSPRRLLDKWEIAP